MSYSVLSKTYYLKAGDEEYRMHEGERVKRIVTSSLVAKEKIKKLYLNFTTLKGQYHPRFFGLISGICRAIITPDKENENLEVLVGNSIFFLILLIGMYKIGKLVYDTSTGVFLSFFISFLPIIFPHLRVPMLDLPLTAMYVLSVFFLLKTEYFSSLFYSVCGGIIWGLSLLTKESFLIFFLPVFLYYVWLAIKKQKKISSDRIYINIFISLALFLLITGIVYFNTQNYREVIKIYSMKGSLKIYHDGRQNNFFWYVFVFPFIYFYPIIFIALTPFFIIYVLRKDSEEKKVFLYPFIISVFLFSLSPNKSIRFLMPLVPIFTLMCIGGMNKVLKGNIKIIYFVGLITFSLFQFNMVNSKSPLYSDYYNRIITKFANWQDEHGVLFPFQRQKDKDYLLFSEPFSKILESEHNKKIVITSTFIDHRLLAVLMKELMKRGIGANFLTCAHDLSYLVVSLEKFSNDPKELIRKSNYVIDIDNVFILPPLCGQLKNAFINNQHFFTLLVEIPINHEYYGNIKVLIYKNKNL